MALPQDWSEFFPNEPPPLIPRPICLYLIFLVPAPNPHNWPLPLALQRAWCDKFTPHGTHSAPCQFTIKHISVCHGPWPNVNSWCMLVPRLMPTPRGNTRSLFSSRSSFKIKREENVFKLLTKWRKQPNQREKPCPKQNPENMTNLSFK